GQGQAVTAIDPGPSVDVDESGAVLLVHVLGAVREPGLVELGADARIVDAVAAAGGFSEDADQGGVNLARAVNDGEQLVVPRVGESPPPSVSSAPGLVDLNTADAVALEALPGIGPALAGRIVDWRETNGPFARVEDLQ